MLHWEYYDLDSALCRSIGRNPNIHGRVSVKNGFVDVRLSSFGGKFEIKWTDSLALRLENGFILTLIEKDLLPPGRFQAGNNIVATQHLWSNLSLCGRRKWNKSDKVGAVTFELSNSDALYDPEALRRRLKQVAKSKFSIPNSGRRDLIKTSCDGLDIDIYFGFSSGGENFFSERVTIVPNITIDFTTGVSVKEAVRASLTCARFFGFSIAYPMVPKYMRVYSYSDKHKERREWQEFLLYAPFSEAVSDRRETDPRDSVFFLEDSATRTQLKKSLSIWMNRRAEWENVYELVDKLFSFGRILSGERLETAFKIVEKTPYKPPEDERWNKKVDSLVSAFSESDVSKTFSGSFKSDGSEKKRVLDRIRSLKYESGPMRIERLFDHLRKKWPHEYDLSSWFFGNIKEAWTQRGKTAHGKIIINNRDDFTKFTYAAETFAIMLVACDLSLGTDPVRKLGSGRLMTYQKGMYHAQPPDVCKKYEEKYPKYAYANRKR